MINFLKQYLLWLIPFYSIVILFIFIKINSSDYDENIDLKDIALKNHYGELKSIEDYKGKVLLMDFWFSGCTPCLNDMKNFPSLLEKYPDNLAIMSVTFDADTLTQRLLTEKKGRWNFLIADNPNWTFSHNKFGKDYIKRLNINSYPTYLLFNKKGELISTPFSALLGVEMELSGIFGINLTIEKKIKPIILVSLKLLIIYSFAFSIIYTLFTLVRKFIIPKHHDQSK